MLVERSTDGTSGLGHDGVTQPPDGPSMAEAFVAAHPSAKLVFIIDTHCLENGHFVWTGKTPQDLSACELIEVHNLDCRLL